MFRELGKNLGAGLRKGNWLLQGLTGTEDQRIEAEYRFGQDLASEARKILKIPVPASNASKAQELSQVGATLAACLKNKRRRFDFTIIDSAEPNAFSLPGGFIFVEQSLLQLCEWQRDEVGFILGHEMAHVVLGHAFENEAGRELVDLLARAFIPGQGYLRGALQRIVGQSIQRAYSREQEFDADRFSIRVGKAAGLDSQGAMRLLDRLCKHSDMQSSTKLCTYFADHPRLEERVIKVKRYL
jgi:predicted Zn-dependent protease